jgi:phenylacetate-CoA ligase
LSAADNARRAIFRMKTALLRPGARRYAAQLAAEERLPVVELEALNWRRRQAIFRHAITQVPYYRSRYRAAGLSVDSLREPADWLRIPPLTKAELRAHFADLRAEGVGDRQVRLSATGGSTGEPVKVLFDRRVPLEAFGWRLLEWWGVDPADSAAFVFRRVRTGWSEVLNAALWWPTRRTWLDASSYSREEALAFLDRLRHMQPSWLQGYVGAVADVADLCAKGAKASSDKLKAVWVTSAPLDAATRRRIEAGFGAPVYDQYGCGEVFWLASECSHRNGLHSFHTRRHLEFLADNGEPAEPETLGDVHLTDLENRVFPLLRYANGDRGRWLSGTCPCGVTWPRIDGIKGRISDALLLPGGRTLSGDFLTTLFDGCPEVVEAFQVRQRSDGSIMLRCSPSSVPGARQRIDEVHAVLRGKVAGAVNVGLELVTRIDHDGGKTRFVVREGGSA